MEVPRWAGTVADPHRARDRSAVRCGSITGQGHLTLGEDEIGRGQMVGGIHLDCEVSHPIAIDVPQDKVMPRAGVLDNQLPSGSRELSAIHVSEMVQAVPVAADRVDP